MRKHHSIAPFPTELDRQHFPSWLSGFTDGEGSFVLLKSIRKGCEVAIADFSIALRADDVAILHLIRSFFQCGNMSYYGGESYRRRKNPLMANPRMTFHVTRLCDICRVIVPHFTTYPLLAKKSRDFAIWKEAVQLQYTIQQRPRQVRGRGHGFGTKSKWTAAEHAQFDGYMKALKEQRRYNAESIDIPKARPEARMPDLFD